MLLTATIALATLAGTSATPLLKRQQNRSYPDQSDVGPTPHPEWIAAYEEAKAAGKLGNYQPAQVGGNGQPYYAGVDPGSKGICSWTVTQCFAEDDISDAPTGAWGLAFDDGPTYASGPLYNFLEQNNQSATHFMIGGNVLAYPNEFQQALATGGHLAVHTWTHPYMTTMTDMQILGELGWTAQIIFDNSGLIPSFWRPPYGDVDNRVRAIAKEVFGLQTVIWNDDSADWCLTEGGGSSCGSSGPTSDGALDAEFQGWAAGPKSPGKVILQHERTSRSVGSFLRTYGGIKAAGWDVKPIPDLYEDDWYLNAASNTAPKDDGISIGAGYSASGGNSTSAAVSSTPSTVPASMSPSSAMSTSVLTSTATVSTTSSSSRSSSSTATFISSASSRAPTANAAASSSRPTSAGVKMQTASSIALASVLAIVYSVW